MVLGIVDPNFEPILGPKIGSFFVILRVIFGSSFLILFGLLWGHFGDHFGTRSTQEGAKMGPRGPPRASNTQNPAFAKTLKQKLVF